MFAIQTFGLGAELEGYVCPDPPEALYPDPDAKKPVKLVMRGAGTIEGSVALPEQTSGYAIRAVVVRPSGDDVPKKTFEDCIDSEGKFRLSGILPGNVTVRLELRDVAEPLATIPDVNVRRLRSTDDARLRNIDLRQHPALRR